MPNKVNLRCLSQKWSATQEEKKVKEFIKSCLGCRAGRGSKKMEGGDTQEVRVMNHEVWLN